MNRPTREFPAGVEVMPAVEADPGLEALWDRFEIFEALHHSMRIANPMSSDDLDEVIAMLAPAAGERALDIACGAGESLCRVAAAASIGEGLGIDLSPWMIAAAARHAATLPSDVAAPLRWMVGEGAQAPADPVWDLVLCLGATWIWHGTNGTVRAIAERAASGGRVAIGDMQLRPGRDADEVAKEYGTVVGDAEMDAIFDRHGLDVIGRVYTADESWDAYIERTGADAAAWAERYPGPRADGYVEEQRTWLTAHARDRDILTWVVWVGRKR